MKTLTLVQVVRALRNLVNVILRRRDLPREQPVSTLTPAQVLRALGNAANVTLRMGVTVQLLASLDLDDIPNGLTLPLAALEGLPVQPGGAVGCVPVRITAPVGLRRPSCSDVSVARVLGPFEGVIITTDTLVLRLTEAGSAIAIDITCA